MRFSHIVHTPYDDDEILLLDTSDRVRAGDNWQTRATHEV
jgi:hypothetical protein